MKGQNVATFKPVGTSTFYESQTSIVDLLVRQGLLADEQTKLLEAHSSVRVVHPAHVLLVEGFISRKAYHDFVVNKLGVQEVNLVGVELDRSVATLLKQTFVKRHQVLPIEKHGKTLVVAMLDPTDDGLRREIEELTGCSVVPRFASDVDLSWQFHEVFGKPLVHRAVYSLFWTNPESSAATVITPRQAYVLIAAVGVFLFALTLAPIPTLLVVSSSISGFYLFSIAFKFLLTMAGTRYETVRHVSRKELRELRDEDLPIYTILVPIYKEANVLKKLNAGMLRLDYPKEKLDIKLLMEQDDVETLEAIKALETPAVFEPVIVPNFGPRTKPKACNYGLYYTKGQYLTIFDAEDIPEPDQLKKALIRFQKETDDVVVVQAALNYFNRNENFLTKMFTLEYSYWFDYLLRGMDRLKIPIPLGGTSNHFRVDRLRELGGWDPFNVTEDADLGIRASARGYRVAVFDSTTYEEANRALGNWIRQRSRWIKGYIQTWLVHTRHPIRLFKTVGWRAFFGFHFFVGATPATFLINPILWLTFFLWLLIRMKWIDLFFPPIILYISLFNLLIGNLIIVYMNMLAVFKRRTYELTAYALLNPAYWVLHSIASYKALWQLIHKPFYWEKTTHGLTEVGTESLLAQQ